MDARRLVKRVALAAAQGAVLPVVVAFRAETRGADEHRLRTLFAGYSQALAMVPGLSGQLVRRAFYGAVLAECHPDTCIQWGTTFSTPDAVVSKGVYIGANCSIGRAVLNEHVTLGSNVHVLSGKNQHGIDDPDAPVQEQPGRFDQIRIGRNTWLGNGAIVLADVGDRCVVAAGAVVIDAVPDDSVVGGNPARILRRRDPVTKAWVRPS
ncbi:MAG: transferase hexapeptide repeat containing protein [Myxococcaceae bacterium]|nr:transferase hexapeptide repeat containing protein [Myxococcaceae bacterium]